LMLVNHENTFTTKKTRPTYLTNIELAIGDQWRTALLGLDDETLQAELGDVLGKRHLAALAKRRDGLVKESMRP